MRCDDYRGVTCTTYKIMANSLCVELAPYAEEIIGECQILP